MNVDTILTFSLLILFITAIVFIACRILLHKWYQAIPVLGIFASGFSAFLPLNETPEFFLTLVSSGLDAVKLFILETSYLETIDALTAITGSEYLFGEFVFAILYIAAPICTAVIIISLISDYLVYAGLKLPIPNNRYIFSELNEKTFSLSQSMKEHGMSGLYIFCGVERSKHNQNLFYSHAKKNNSIVIDRNILSIPPSKKKDSFYFVISDDSSKNIDIALSLMDKHQKCSNVKIFITSNEVEDEALLDNMSMKLENEKVNVRHINETQLMAYELLQENPLYNVISPTVTHVSMLIIGGGSIGIEILKSSLWCSRSLNYTFEVTVVDKDIKKSAGVFHRQCPGIIHEDYGLSFHQHNIDAETDDLMKFIEENKGKFNYIVIATSDDETNIKTAFDLRAWYEREKYSAIISVNVRDEQKYNLITRIDKTSLCNDMVKIFPFGCNLLMYSYEKIIDSTLEKAAICINGIYKQTYENHMHPEGSWKLTYESSLENWRELPLQKRRSSMALGVFVKYILWMWISERESKCSEDQFYPTDAEIMKYAELEHKRWCTYHLIEGYYPWPYDEFIQFSECMTHSARDETRRLHACIADWKTIQKIDSELDSCYAKYNEEYIKHLPEILCGFQGEFGYQYDVGENE